MPFSFKYVSFLESRRLALRSWVVLFPSCGMVPGWGAPEVVWSLFVVEGIFLVVSFVVVCETDLTFEAVFFLREALALVLVDSSLEKSLEELLELSLESLLSILSLESEPLEDELASEE